IQLAETRKQAEGLTIVAATSGRVVARKLNDLADTYVNQGDDLLIVDDGQPRELIVSVAQQDFSLAVKQCGTSVALKIGTRAGSTGIVQRVTPRASTQLPSPALASPAGGTLPVVADSSDSENELRLTEPRFHAIIELSAGPGFHESIGERGYVRLGRSEHSLATYVYHQSAEWLRDQIETAQAVSRQQLQ
ncbi:MAG: hypothetical protein GY826_25330, partial [Fuerstiella sp.]|nr:hypothetical protein [Fuerstiella sp.]